MGKRQPSALVPQWFPLIYDHGICMFICIYICVCEYVYVSLNIVSLWSVINCLRRPVFLPVLLPPCAEEQGFAKCCRCHVADDRLYVDGSWWALLLSSSSCW